MSEQPSAFRPSRLSPAEEQSAQKLEERFKALKAATGMSQKQFAEEFKMPGKGPVITQHIKKQRPISMEQAKAYMRGFGCTLEEISPTLASQLPGPPVIPEQLATRLASADDATRKLVEIALYASDDSALEQLSPSLRSLIGFVKQQIAEEMKHGDSAPRKP